jgi:hypothetical protein
VSDLLFHASLKKMFPFLLIGSLGSRVCMQVWMELVSVNEN